MSRPEITVSVESSRSPNHPLVTAPIVGPRTVDQFEGSLGALEIELSEDVLTRLDEIWPGPGGQAPEAYAW